MVIVAAMLSKRKKIAGVLLVLLFLRRRKQRKSRKENCLAAVGYYGVGIVVSIRNFAESWKQNTGLHLSTTAA